MLKPRSILILALHKRLQALQLKNLFISRAYGTELTLIESHVLVELARADGVSQTTLIAALNLHKVVVSRAVASLKKSGLLHVKSSQGDARIKNCTLTSAGVATLKQLDAKANRLMQQFCSYLSKPQEAKLYSLWNALCDGLNAPPVVQRNGIHPLLVPGRRQSRCMGLLGTTVFGEVALSSLEWHWLSLVQSKQLITAVELSQRLGLVPATGTALVRRITQRGFVSSASHPTDRRSQALQLTPTGERTLKKVEKAAVSQIERATEEISHADLSDMLNLFNRFGADLVSCPAIDLTQDFTVRVITEDDDISDCRGFLLTALVEHRLQYTAVASVCDPHNVIVSLEDRKGRVALVEISSSGETLLYAIAKKSTPRSVLIDFCALSKDLCERRFGRVPLLRSGGAIPELVALW
jgi:DNA-binding MarR family transcriptional regulator